MSLRLAEDVQWQLDPLHFLVTLDRFTGLRHGIDQRELDAFGVALRPEADLLQQLPQDRCKT